MMKNFIQENKIPLFSSLEEEELEILAQNFELKTFHSGERIITEGDEGNCFYLIKTGTVKVITIDQKSNEEIVLSYLEPGDYFGEMSLITDEPRSASVISDSEVEVFILAKEKFKELLNLNPKITLSLTHMLSHRLNETNRTFIESQKYYISQGYLEDMEVVALLKYLEENLLSGILDLTRDNETARFYFRKGQLLDLDYKAMNEADAMDEILNWNTAEFVIKPEILPFVPLETDLEEELVADRETETVEEQDEITPEPELDTEAEPEAYEEEEDVIPEPDQPAWEVAEEEFSTPEPEFAADTETEAFEEQDEMTTEPELDTEAEPEAFEEGDEITTEPELDTDMETETEIYEEDEDVIPEQEQLLEEMAEQEFSAPEAEPTADTGTEAFEEQDGISSEPELDTDTETETEIYEEEEDVIPEHEQPLEEIAKLEISTTSLFNNYIVEKIQEFNRFAGMQLTKNALQQSYYKFKDYFEVIQDLSIESSPEVHVSISTDSWSEKHTLFIAVLLRNLAHTIEREVVGIEFWTPESNNPGYNTLLRDAAFFEYFEQATDFMHI